jgi:hypothetical protein
MNIGFFAMMIDEVHSIRSPLGSYWFTTLFFKGKKRSKSLTVKGRTFFRKRFDRKKLNPAGYRQYE